MKIIYFPGFGGSEKSNTFLEVLSKHPEAVAIIYDNTNADKAFLQIQEQFEKISLNNSLIIGQSLGGFWAEHFAVKYHLNLILINPSFEPFESLKKYDIPSENLETFRKFKSIKRAESTVSIILSKEDTVVNPKPVLEKYQDFATFKSVEGGHKFTAYDVLLNEIEKFVK